MLIIHAAVINYVQYYSKWNPKCNVAITQVNLGVYKSLDKICATHFACKHLLCDEYSHAKSARPFKLTTFTAPSIITCKCDAVP